jgi:hypothetical protein
MSLPEVLQWVKFSQKTGTIIFERRGVVKKIFVEKGLIISASSNDPKEYLGQVLICFGWIDEEKLNEAFKLQASSQSLLGKILCETYGLKEENILRALRIKIEETVYDLFLWEDGKFIYTDENLKLPQHACLDTAITIDQVMFEGARRTDEWKEFRRSFPTDDVVFKYKEPQKPIGELAKDFIIQKIFDFIDGEKPMRRILLETRAPEYRGFEAFGKLFWAGLIEPTKKTIAREKPSPVDPADLLKKAMEHYKAKEFEKSFVMIEELLKSNPANADAQTLFNLAQSSYVVELYAKCPADSVPELTIDISNLSEKVFSSRDGFLASRVNGQWDVKSLVMISPLGELESLRILKRLVDEGVIRLKKK